jgi:hypothetical protein
MRRREFKYPQKATKSIVSPNPRKRGRPTSAKDKVSQRLPRRKGPEPLASLKESVEEVQPKLENAPKLASQLVHRVKSIACADQNTPTQSLWKSR